MTYTHSCSLQGIVVDVLSVSEGEEDQLLLQRTQFLVLQELDGDFDAVASSGSE